MSESACHGRDRHSISQCRAKTRRQRKIAATPRLRGCQPRRGRYIADPRVAERELREERRPHWLEVAQFALRRHLGRDRNGVQLEAEVQLDPTRERSLVEWEPAAVGRQAAAICTAGGSLRAACGHQSSRQRRTDEVEEHIWVGRGAHDDRRNIIRPRAQLQVQQARPVPWSIATLVDVPQQPCQAQLESSHRHVGLRPRDVDRCQLRLYPF